MLFHALVEMAFVPPPVMNRSKASLGVLDDVPIAKQGCDFRSSDRPVIALQVQLIGRIAPF
jgi:hypothetical protein